jgi:uncharacterized glyoxalase superfamily protein PhnB
MTTAQSTLQAVSLMAGFTVNDLQRTIRFYEGLGFTVGDRFEENGELRGVMLQAGNAQLGISQDDGAKGKNRVKGVGCRIWLSTEQDVDELATKAKGAGVKLDADPADMPWGARAFAVTDPDGFQLTISRETKAD